MEHDQTDILELKSEIINTFRPIEQLFKIMDKSSSELSGDIARSCAEVGLELCQDFRQKLDDILPPQGKDSDNDCQ
jgi:hypothetical protein